MSKQAQEKKEIRVFLVDDHTVVRQGTRDMLNAHYRINVVGEAACAEDLLAQLEKMDADLLLLDINLPDQSGFELYTHLKKIKEALPVVFFSAHTDLPYILKAVQIEARGFLSKTIDTLALQEAVIKAIDDPEAPVYSEDVLDKLKKHKKQAPEKKLTTREFETLLEVARGHTNQEVADKLCVSVKTVDTHVSNLMKKLGMNKRSQLTAYAYEHRYL